MGNFKPYFIEEENSGIATDIITAVFNKLPEYDPVYRYGMPVKSAWLLFEKKKIDAVANLFDAIEIDGCKTDPVIRFRDVVISRRESGFKINSWADLNGKSIVTFQGAQEFFGQNLINVITRGSYIETSNQGKQANMLNAGRVDVSIGDLFIFRQGLSEIESPLIDTNDFVVHDFLPQISSRIAFHDKTMCPLFNAALKELKQSGGYEAIYARYRKKFGIK